MTRYDEYGTVNIYCSEQLKEIVHWIS